MRHKLATFFLYLAYKLEPEWIEHLLKVPKDVPEPEQTPEPPLSQQFR